MSLPFLNSGRELLAMLEHSPVLGQTARHPRPFQSLEVTQAPGPGGQILLWDMWLLLACSSWLQSQAGTVERPSGSCHLEKDRFSPCLPHKLAAGPTAHHPDPKDAPACPPRVEGTGCHQPALYWRVQFGWQRVLVTRVCWGGKSLM